jgi:hypothetical protein
MQNSFICMRELQSMLSAHEFDELCTAHQKMLGAALLFYHAIERGMAVRLQVIAVLGSTAVQSYHAATCIAWHEARHRNA